MSDTEVDALKQKIADLEARLEPWGQKFWRMLCAKKLDVHAAAEALGKSTSEINRLVGRQAPPKAKVLGQVVKAFGRDWF